MRPGSSRYTAMVLGLTCTLVAAADEATPEMTAFEAIANAAEWQTVFRDDGRGNWQDKWFLDGDSATARNTAEGMVLTAGSNLQDNGDSLVLWTQDSFAGDIRIGYDFTRLDHLDRNVNILYLHAAGTGVPPYGQDIRAWAELRRRAQMSLYFRNMRLLHISYAVNRHDVEGEYIRARCYPVPPGGNFGQDTEIQGTAFDTKLFKPGITYRFTVVKRGDRMFFRVTGDGQDRLFQWDLSAFAPVNEGRIGLRQMPGRQSRYANIEVSVWGTRTD